MSKNDISFAYRLEGLGRRRRSTALRAMIAALDSHELPEWLAVTWRWRNTVKQDMREDDFVSAVEGSRAGFVVLMRRRLERDLALAIAAEGETHGNGRSRRRGAGGRGAR